MLVADTLRVYLVLDLESVTGDPVQAAECALRGGVTMLQMRGKHRTDRELVEIASHLRTLCDQHDVPFIVNDRLDIAMAAGAAGVHLGVNDVPVSVARTLAGDDFIIGFSPETDGQISQSRADGASYLGIGPVYGTSTKRDAGAALGLKELARRARLGGLPSVGIGGITPENANDILRAGVDGVAVVSAILGAPDIEYAARQFSRNAYNSSTRGSSAGSQ